MATTPPAVSCSWLKDNLDKVKVLDASWYLPVMERSPGVKMDARADFESRRIPGALFFDIDKICDASSPWPHMMPTAELMSSSCSALGISRDDHVVVYDGKGIFSAPRAWFMFKVAGHSKVSILDGGFPQWEREKVGAAPPPAVLEANPSLLQIEQGAKRVDAGADVPATYTCEINRKLLLDTAAVEENIVSKQRQLLDARPKPRYVGAAPEPRPIESGHIEGSYCVPWTDVLTADFTFKDEAALRNTMQAAKVDLGKPVAISCGSGVSACVVGAALHLLGVTDTPLYDGAYTEWKTSGKPTFKDLERSPYE